MDALGITAQPVIRTLPGATQAFSAPAAPAVPEVPVLPHQVEYNAQAAEQRRFEGVRRAAQEMANMFAVSDKTFTIFKDASGQYITRFTSLRDGRVTYFPEPNLVRAGAPAMMPVLHIDA